MSTQPTLRIGGVDAGGLDESWRQQPGTPVYAQDSDAEGVRRALSEPSPDRTPQWRATANSPGDFASPARLGRRLAAGVMLWPVTPGSRLRSRQPGSVAVRQDSRPAVRVGAHRRT